MSESQYQWAFEQLRDAVTIKMRKK